MAHGSLHVGYALPLTFTALALTLAGCMSQYNPMPLNAGSDPGQRLVQWERCLETSYAEARKKTADPNAAADLAFRACESDEWQLEVSALRAGAVPDDVARRRTEWRRALVQTGHIS